ncbi:MAG: SDR family oxidoreductase [Planctomycetota bacterium]
MDSALVTGGAGFIGSHITAALAARGVNVRVLDNLSTGKRANLEAIGGIGGPVSFVEGDVLQPEALDAAIDGVDVVFHQSAMASVPASVRSPVASHEHCATGTVRVLDAAQRLGVGRVVYAASSAAYGDATAGAKRESDPPSPMSPYAAAKIAGEMYCRAFAECFDLHAVSLRYFNVYGPRQDPEGEYSAVIPKFVTRMLSGSRPVVFGDGKQSRDFVFVEDVVQANLAAAETPAAAGGCFNVARGEQTTLLELIDAINAALGIELEPEFQPPRAGDPKESLADISKSREVLGYEPQVDFRDGLLRSIDYYRSVAS